ncbi:hypothetical protein CPB86DRAFT_145103 [Serendipita vermifera]|nr:hypothetical protein CPB86DRAFT_145103 [Serendipita vermifera]
MLEDALRTIAVSMANCEFYASIFADALHRQFTSSETSAAWEKQLETALPEFYAAVIIFSIKVKGYFISSTTGRMANSFKPFSIAFRAHLEQIENKEKRLKELAGMATMEGVKDIRQKMEILGEMKEIFVQISDKEALTWLNAIRPDPVYNFNKFRRLEGTCEWIFEAQKYQSWIDRTGSRDLWVVGIPGAGKSVLATHIIDKLRERDDSLTLYFLFRDGDSQTVSPLEMVARIIAQLIDSDIDKERLMRVLKLRVQSSLHFTNKATESREFEKLCAALIEMLRGFPMPVIIVLDALDECSDPSSVPRHLLEPANNPSSIAHMMLMPDTGEKIQVQFLLTGRPNVHDIFAPLRYVSTLDMDVNEDIRKFINEKVADNEGLRRHESQIVATIYENTQGMFRYAALVLEELNEPSPEPISERLKTMPKGITGMYELILSRLGSKGSTWEHKMRQKLLLWVTLAQRSIKVPEMQYAFATIEGRKSFDPDVVVLPSAKQMLSSCGSLLEVSKEDELRFTHRTVKEFLLQPLEKLSEDARKNENITSCMVDEAEGHASMAITCVTQLFSKGIKQLASIISTEPWNDEEFAAEMKMQFDQKGLLPLAQSPFNYAVSYWLKHAMDVPHGIQSTPRSRELWELVRDFFWDQDGIIFKEWVRVLDPYHDSWHTTPIVSGGSVVRCLYPWHKPHITSGLHVAASYGLVDIIEWAHPDGVDFEIRTSPHNSPLVEAACQGEDDVVKALLSKDNVDPNWSACRMSTIGECLEAECKNGWFTPLVAAIRYQRLGVIKLLLKQPGINVDLVSHGNTPLGVAVDDKYPEFIELLVGAGAKLAMRWRCYRDSTSPISLYDCITLTLSRIFIFMTTTLLLN